MIYIIYMNLHEFTVMSLRPHFNNTCHKMLTQLSTQESLPKSGAKTAPGCFGLVAGDCPAGTLRRGHLGQLGHVRLGLVYEINSD